MLSVNRRAKVMNLQAWLDPHSGFPRGIDPKGFQAAAAIPKPTFENVFITGTIPKLTGPDSFE